MKFKGIEELFQLHISRNSSIDAGGKGGRGNSSVVPSAGFVIEGSRVRVPAEGAGDFCFVCCLFFFFLSIQGLLSVLTLTSVSVLPPCYRNRAQTIPVILPKVQAASYG